MLLQLLAKAQNESYHGGDGDGHSFTAQLTAFSFPDAFQPYIGASGDGYALAEPANTALPFPVQFYAYLGGDADGWTSVLKPNVTILPLTLLQFSGTRGDGRNILSWRTAQEVNTYRFDVERSATGAQFTKIGSMAARGNFAGETNYRFIDSTPLPSVNYYRLNMIDIDGSSRYSAIVLLQPDAASRVVLYPNPTRGLIYLQVNSIVPATCTIMDMNGRKLFTQVLQPGAAAYQVDVRQLAPGTYLLQLDWPGRVQTLSFVRQ